MSDQKHEKTNKEEKEEKKVNNEKTDKAAKGEKNEKAGKGTAKSPTAKSPTANGSKDLISPDKAKVRDTRCHGNAQLPVHLS